MSSRPSALGSSVGTKIIIGFTGLALFLYLITHIAGNLLVFLGPDIFNHYAHTLSNNPLIKAIEVGLLLIFVVHVIRTVKMYMQNQQARPAKYVQKNNAGGTSRKSFASSTMIVSGLWLLAFVVLHVKAFKYGAHYQTADGVHDLYKVEMENFSSPLVVGFYVLSMLVVGSHLSHGITSACQSLGLNHPTWTPRVLTAGKVVAALIAVGFIIIALWAHLVGGVRA